MKKCFQILAAAVAVMTVSCAKQAEIDTVCLDGSDVKAYFEAGIGMKATLDGTSVSWESGDQIAVYQYGKYKYDTNRDSKDNIFTSDGSLKFSGTIAGYKLRDESGDIDGDKKNSVAERFYAVYPAASCSACGVTTAKYKVVVPAAQTGSIADFKQNAIFLGYLNADPGKMGPVTSYDESTNTLTFTRAFDMYCITPVLKFNVPASLGINKIVVSGIDADSNDVSFAANLNDLRSDSNWNPTTEAGKESITNGTPVTVSHSDDSVISGDVYVFIAPDAGELIDKKGDVFQWTQYSSTAKTVKFVVSTADGKSATLVLPITGDIKAGTIKNLPAFPTTIPWDLPVGPGIASVTTNGDGSAEKATIILTSAEDEESTVYYKTSEEGFDKLATQDYIEYNEEGFTAEGINYTEFKVVTEGYVDNVMKAMIWTLNNQKGFGKEFSAYAGTPAVGTTFPVDGSFLYNLQFTYTGLASNSDQSKNKNIPQINSFLLALQANSAFCYGDLSVKIPEDGKAKLFIQLKPDASARTLKILKGTTEIYSANVATGGVTVHNTSMIDVKEGDILKISRQKLNIISMALIWEPVPATATSSTESYSGRTGYDL